jgi:arylsulfatase A-like enzyme
MITRLDADVGKLVRLIDELGLATETLIILTSDNGPWGGMPRLFNSAGPLRGEKRQLYEGGIRVPFIARRPGYVPAGKVSHEVIAFWDMMPTFAELAGTEAPADIDGISVAAALRGEAVQAPREYLYWDYGHNRETYHQAIRMGDWKGVRHGQGGRVEIYDLSKDSAEAHDVAAEHAEIVCKIEQLMRAAVTPSRRYEVGKLYEGGPIWQSSAQ